MSNKQKCIEFKHNVFFIIQKSKNKQIISRKTFILELIGYLIFLSVLMMCIIGVLMNVQISILLLGISALIALSFGCVTGYFYGKTKKYNH